MKETTMLGTSKIRVWKVFCLQQSLNIYLLCSLSRLQPLDSRTHISRFKFWVHKTMKYNLDNLCREGEDLNLFILNTRPATSWHFWIWINPVKAAELHLAFNNLLPPSASSYEKWTWSIWTLPLRLLAASQLSSLPLNNNIPTVSPRQRQAPPPLLSQPSPGFFFVMSNFY